MESRFALKDFLLLVIVLAVGVAVVLAMYQEDRRWAEARAMRDTLTEQTAMLANMQRRIEETQARVGDQASALKDIQDKLARGATLPAPASSSAAEARPGSTSDSWARPGVPITRPRPWDVVKDPRAMPNYAEGGTLTEIFEGTPQKLTPYVYNDVYYARIVNEVVCESLAMFDSDSLKLRGWLAEAWQYDPEGMWLRVKIRDEARFSDGTPVTAEDVRYTYMDYVFNQEIQADVYRSQMNVVKGVKVISERVAEFEFVAPKFINLWGALRYGILPKHFYAQFTPSQINTSTGLLLGSGAYRVERPGLDGQWKPGEPLVLVRNEQYWGTRQPPDRLRYSFITDNVARLTEFENGRADIMRATPEQFRRKSQEPAFLEKNRAMAWTNMRSGYAFISWNCGERGGRPTPFSDKRVRQAMALMTDRDRINRDFYEGLAEVCVGPFPPSQSDPTVKPWPFDLDRARALLEEAGWKDRDGNGILENERGDEFAYEYTYATGSSLGEKVGKYLIDQGAKAGIKVTLRVTDWAAMQTMQDNKDFDALTLSWSWSNPESDPYQIFHSSQATNEGDNWGSWINPKADELIERGRRSVNEAERMQVWHELHRLIADEQPYMFLLNIPWIRFVSNRIENVHEHPVCWDRREFFIPRERQ
jgi:peptide/nickel transport system substrate-binding protein